jgi:hypothetical protein
MPLDTSSATAEWHSGMALLRSQMPAADMLFNPVQHMARFGATLSPKVAIIGDSTGLEAGNNAIGYVDNLWGYLTSRLRQDNPGRTITFGNYSVGGSAMTSYAATGDTLIGQGLSLGSWFTPTTNTWISFVSAFAPDLLFVNWGVNDAYTLTTSTLTAFLTAVAAFPKIPDIVFITGKSSNASAGGIHAANNYVAGRLNAAALLRTVAMSQGRKLNIAALNLPVMGVLDIARAWEIAAIGRDPAMQDLFVRQTNVAGITTFPYDFAATEGDFLLDMTWPAQGSAMQAAGTIVTVGLGAPQGDTAQSGFLQFQSLAGSQFFANLYSAGGLIEQANINNWSTTDNRMIVHVQGDRIQVRTQTTTVLDAQFPRYAGPFTPRVTLTTPHGSPSMTINTYANSRMRRTGVQLTRLEAWGSTGAAMGGNGVNHGASLGLNKVDRWFLQNTSFAVPLFPNRTGRVHIAAGAVTITRDDDMVVVNKTTGAATTANLPANYIPFKEYVVKDGKGDAGTNNITITPAAGTIDGAATNVISTNYGLRRLMHNTTQWNVVG